MSGLIVKGHAKTLQGLAIPGDNRLHGVFNCCPFDFVQAC